VSLKLIKALLNKEFYDKYRHKLSKKYFISDNNAKDLFKTIEKAYETLTKDLTVDSLRELHYSYNPAITASNKAVLEELFTELSNLDLTKESSEEVLKQTISQTLWFEMADIGLNASNGQDVDFFRAQEILDNIKEGISLTTDIKVVEGSLEEMLEATSQQAQWKFHIPTLRQRIDGIGKSTFTLIAARPNIGKTGFTASLIAQPGGFLDQGARVTYIGNEESAVRTRLRMASCYSGFTRADFADNKKKQVAQEKWDSVRDKLTVLDAAGYSIEELDEYVKHKRKDIDILVVDVLDKLNINGSYATETDKLYRLYTVYREMLKRYDIAGIGTSQASADAENRALFGMDCLANSKTGKGGELDVCFCLGRHLEVGEVDPGWRTLNIAKNKLTGVEDNVTFMMDFSTNRVTA